MTVDIAKIFEEWEKDGAIDQSDISRAATNIPKIHNKYFRHYVEEGLKLKKLKAEYKILVRNKTEWYKGDLDEEELKEHGWKPQPLKILRADIPQYLESDSDIIRKTLVIGLQEEVVSYLESIVKQINNRNFILKTIVDFERFKGGG
jgi:hypothetical protein